jgi:hypothetical protein
LASILEFLTADFRGQLGWAGFYAAYCGYRIFPTSSRKIPLVKGWQAAATTDLAQIWEWWGMQWPAAEIGWALPVNIVVADLDEKDGRHGFRDFERLEGCDLRSVAAPVFLTPSGGAQILYLASKPYKNVAPAIKGMGIDTRAAGGFVLLPGHQNGRRWLKSPLDVEMPPAPVWLAPALRETRTPAAPTSPDIHLMAASDPWAQRSALKALDRACTLIVNAQPGERHDTCYKQCFFIGGLIERGDIAYETAKPRLLEVIRAVAGRHRPPWRNVDKWVEESIQIGITKPIPLTDTQIFMRSLLARLAEAKR